MSLRGATFLGVGSMVGAGIFALLGEAGSDTGSLGRRTVCLHGMGSYRPTSADWIDRSSSLSELSPAVPVGPGRPCGKMAVL